MAVRLLLTDEAWAALAPLLAPCKSRAGSPPALRERLLSAAGLSRAWPGTPWRALPAEVGPWDAVYHRLRRWERRGGWRRLWEHLPGEQCPRTRHRCREATLGRAPQHAAGA